MTRATEYKMIVAVCRGGGIGYEGQLPWPKLARDMRFFAEMTSSSMVPYNSAVVMGRRTWESIPASVRPLKFRDNFVVSALHDTAVAAVDADPTDHPTGVTFIKNLSEIHEHAKNYDTVWFIGGASIYEQVLSSPESFPINDIYITFVDETYEHDTAFPLMYQYDSIEEWEALQNNPMNRAIWCWTGGDDIPDFVSFFAEGARSNHLYRIMDADREFVASITRPADIKAIQERRTPNTIFLRLSRVITV